LENSIKKNFKLQTEQLIPGENAQIKDKNEEKFS
jgi:hypothetical protein